jgi:hypothetical protein
VPARLLVEHHRLPDPPGVEHAAVVDHPLGIGLEQPREDPLAQQRALPVPPVGVEAVADHGTAVPDHVGDDGDEAERHLAEVDVGVADGGADRVCALSDVDDPHDHPLPERE